MIQQTTDAEPRPIPCTNARCEGGEIRTRAGRFVDVRDCPDGCVDGFIRCAAPGCGGKATMARHRRGETIYTCTRHGGRAAMSAKGGEWTRAIMKMGSAERAGEPVALTVDELRALRKARNEGHSRLAHALYEVGLLRRAVLLYEAGEFALAHGTDVADAVDRAIERFPNADAETMISGVRRPKDYDPDMVL